MFTRSVAGVLLLLGLTVADAQAQQIVFTRADFFGRTVGARAIVAADFDGDGAIDLATASGTANSVSILMNGRKTGGTLGTVRQYPVAAGPFAMAVGDFNGDGKPDIVVASADADRISVLLNAGGGTFTVSDIAAPGSPRGVATGDFNHDGHVDIVYTSYSLNTVSILFGDGNGSFTSTVVAATGRNPEGVAVADVDGDGALDVVVANTGKSPLNIFYGSGNGALRRVDVAGPQQLNSVAIADFDGDGRLDVAAASTAQDHVFVYLNTTAGPVYSKALPASTSNFGIVAADFNKDGRADIAVANRGASRVTIFAATADGTGFRPGVSIAVGTGARTIVAADLDGDGTFDLATGNQYTVDATGLFNRTIIAGPGAVAFELHALPSANPDASPQGRALAVGDFNKNGLPDVVADDAVVLDGTTPLTVAVDRQEVTYGRAVVGDFNGDGNLDFAREAQYPVATPTPQTADVVDVFLGDGRGGFVLGTTLTFASVRGMIAGDVNGGRSTGLIVWDYIAENGTGSPLEERQIILGRADGTFTQQVDVVNPNSLPVGLADMNHDGRLDLVMWNVDTQTISVLGNAQGNFVPLSESPSAGEPVLHPVIADLNEDGIPDVIGIGTSTSSLVVFLGSFNSFSAPVVAPVSATASSLIVADLNDDGRLDYLADDGTFAEGAGDGTFHGVRQINVRFADAIVVDFDGDGLKDIVLNGSGYAAMVLFNRGVVGPNLPPIADAGHDLTFEYLAQFAGTVSLTALRSYDPNLDPLTYQWLDAAGVVRGTAVTLDIKGYAPGTYTFTLVVRDDSGAEARDTATVTITPSQEIVTFADRGSYHGAWTELADPSAADAVAAWHPNANAPKLDAPLANPINYVEFTIHPDPALGYKLWLRLKAERNNWANDSVFVQFDGAVDASGKPVYQIGSTSALAVNLEECLNCGDSGWGWRDDAWGAKGAISGVLVRFPDVGSGVKRIRIQTREDGVMIDQVVLSPNKYRATRPGAVKNDTTILALTEF